MIRHRLATLACASVAAAAIIAGLSAGAAAPARAGAAPTVTAASPGAPAYTVTALPPRGIWATVTGPTTDFDMWADVARGPGGALYAAGSFGVTAKAGDIMVAKFSADDQASKHLVWSDTWDNPAEHLADQADALAVDGSGAPIVAGTTQSATDGTEWVVAKWTTGGTKAWQTVIPARAGKAWYASANDVVCDAAGNVYICGSVQTGTHGRARVMSLVVRKLSGTNGRVVWTRAYAGVAHSVNAGERLVLGSSGDLYCTGFGASSRGDHDMLTCRLLTSTGRLMWVDRIADARHLGDEGVALSVRDSHLWVTGYKTVSATSRVVVLVDYTPAGHRVWLRTWRKAGATLEDPTAMTVDVHHAAVIVGTGVHGSREYAFILHYNASGRLTWYRTAYEVTSHKAVWLGVVGDGTGRIWTVGALPGAAGTSSLLVARYSAAGAVAWHSVWSGPEGLSAAGDSLCLAGNGVFVGGAAITKAGGIDALAAKLTR